MAFSVKNNKILLKNRIFAKNIMYTSMMTGKKNIIFDLGGVLLDIDAEAAFRALAALGMSPSLLNEAACLNDDVMQRFETGQATSYEMFAYVASLLSPVAGMYPADILRNKIEQAWCAMLGNIDIEKMHRLLQLRSAGYKVFLLSNTNETHWQVVENKILALEGRPLSEYFDKCYLSYKMGLRKPSPAIFEALLADAGILAGESIFFDDSQENCDAAASVGIEVVHVERNAPLPAVLMNL